MNAYEIVKNMYNRLFEPSPERKQAIIEAQIALGIDPVKKLLSSDELWARIVTGICPDCGSDKGFHEGPSGGMSTNIYCATCGHRFNVTPVTRTAERI